ncbi:39S ribosomal protein L9, mitochondrial, partial [Asbolus verrucosus]
MWRSLIRVVGPAVKNETCLLSAENILQQQLRTTFILKRRVTPFLTRKGYPQKKLRTRHYVYELVKDTNVEKQPNIDVILTSFVDDLGNAGNKVNVKPHYAYNNLLLPGLAVYATPGNITKFQKVETKDVKHYSSPKVLKMMESLSRLSLSIVMNKDSPWTIQPWHVRASFRKCGFIVPEDAITMPSKHIKGPDLNIEGKEFYVTVTINNTEKVKVRCRIHHWSTNPVEKLPYVEEFWKTPGELLFPENAE